MFQLVLFLVLLLDCVVLRDMGDKMKVTVWHDDEIEEILERFTLVLIEMGIRIELVEANTECVVYELSHAEKLNGEE